MDGAEQHGARPVIRRSEAKSREATEIDVVTATPDEQLIARVGGGGGGGGVIGWGGARRHGQFEQTRYQLTADVRQAVLPADAP